MSVSKARARNELRGEANVYKYFVMRLSGVWRLQPKLAQNLIQGGNGA